MRLLKKTFLLFVGVLTMLTTHAASNITYNYPLYPPTRDLSQTLTFKVMLRCARPEDISNMDMTKVLTYIRQIDCITRGLPKVVILGGFQQDGHDHQYPSWLPVDSTFTAFGGRKGKAALQWLMSEARKYNTHCTFHVNPFDAYDDSPVWEEYVEKDLICRSSSGTLVRGDVWWNRQSYMVNLVNEWHSGVTRQRIDGFIKELPLLKETGVLYFDNLTQYPPSPYHSITAEDQRDAIKKCAEYLKETYNIQLVGEYADPYLYGFGYLGVTWDWHASLGVNQMDVPAYIQCGGRNIAHDNLLGSNFDMSKRRLQVFGSSIQLEDIQFQNDPSKVVREFTHHTLTYFNLNRLLRIKFEEGANYDQTLTLSNGVVSKWEGGVNGEHRLYHNGKLIKQNYDLFLPVYWVNHPEMYAYSFKGDSRTWSFPSEWPDDVTSVDIYTFRKSDWLALEPLRRNVPIANKEIVLTLDAGVAQIIVPAGIDPTKATSIYNNPPTGAVKFVGEDRSTQGNWKGIYGKEGYDLFGIEPAHLPQGVKVGYEGSELKGYNANSSRPVALLHPTDKAKRVEAVRTARLHHAINVDAGSRERGVSIYFADYKEKNCQVLVDAIDVNTKRILHSQLLNDFADGVYLRYNITGKVQLRLTRFFYDRYGNPDFPQCSALFFDSEHITSIEETKRRDNELVCYPNPFADRLTIGFGGSNQSLSEATLTISSITGVKAYERKPDTSFADNKVVINGTDLGQSGIYVVSLAPKGEKPLTKVVMYRR